MGFAEPVCHHTAGGLLHKELTFPTVSTLPERKKDEKIILPPFVGGILSVALSLFLLSALGETSQQKWWLLAIIVSYGARTFLSQLALAAIIRPTRMVIVGVREEVRSQRSEVRKKPWKGDSLYRCEHSKLTQPGSPLFFLTPDF
jgi:hypothetical protein